MLAMFGGSGLMAYQPRCWAYRCKSCPRRLLQTACLPVFLGLSLAFMISNTALQYGAARLAAATTAIVMLTEILFTSLFAALLDAAQFTPRIVLGGSLVVLAALLAALAPAAQDAQTGAESS